MAQAKTTKSQQADRFIVRLPEGMRDRIKREAEKNRRSMTAEIVITLSERFGEEASA